MSCTSGLIWERKNEHHRRWDNRNRGIGVDSRSSQCNFMTDKLRQAAEMALNLIEVYSPEYMHGESKKTHINRLRQALAEPPNTRLQEREWVGLTDEEILAITLDAKITEPNDEPIKFGAPSRKCIKDLVSGVEARLKEKNCA